MEKDNGKLLWRIICIFFIAVGGVIIYIKRSPDMAAAGQAGDSFNGLLAPFISFVGALLVYYSFNEQIKANRIITSQWTFERNLEILKDIISSYRQIEYQSSSSTWSGKQALKSAMSFASIIDLKEEDTPQLKQLEYIFIELSHLLDRIKNVDPETKRFLWLKLDLFIEGELKEPVELFKKRYNEKHFATNVFFDLNSEIDKFYTVYNKRYIL